MLIFELFSTVWINKYGGAIVGILFVPCQIVFTIETFTAKLINGYLMVLSEISNDASGWQVGIG